eukprot:11164284-Lingulodinium_polyedra.AAC.1
MRTPSARATFLALANSAAESRGPRTRAFVPADTNRCADGDFSPTTTARTRSPRQTAKTIV